MTNLIFVGMVGPDSHNREEQRFVEELSGAFELTYYLRGVGIKGLRVHQLRSIPNRLAMRSPTNSSASLRHGSLAILPVRRLGHRLNVAWLTRQLESLVAASTQKWTVWIRFPSPELVDAVEHFPDFDVVYEPIDLYPAAEDLSAEQGRRLAEAELRLITRARVVTGGRRLAERFRRAIGGSTWLSFGLDLEQPDGGQGVPAATPHPRLGMVGCLDWRVDESLLVSLMAGHPDWHLVLAGPRVKPWGRRLQHLSNVHWLGRIPVDRVLPVIRDCDVTLVPYRSTDWTRHCLPVKVFEYLAEGKPVVTTMLPELDRLSEVVTMAGPDQFATAIDAELTSDSLLAQQRRRNVANHFTLQDRARESVRLLRHEARAVLSR